jgi:hypothetical protein
MRGLQNWMDITLQLLHDELDQNITKNSIYSGIEEKLKHAIEANESFTFETSSNYP